MKSIDDCRTIKQVEKVLEEQGIYINPTAFAYCQTITEMIEIAKKDFGAK